MHITRGERVFLLGANGCGKTTLLKIALDMLDADCGTVTHGAGIKIGYYDQLQESLSPHKRIIDEIWDEFPRLTETEVRNALAAFLFRGEEVLREISKLSGGERALTAIAILFAMLRLKPTPFCFLDEIEAALDDGNISTFADYLREFSTDTQFVVVTHRKGTMERCDGLYGVAMEEKGVSTMLSVELKDVGEDAMQ